MVELAGKNDFGQAGNLVDDRGRKGRDHAGSGLRIGWYRHSMNKREDP